MFNQLSNFLIKINYKRLEKLCILVALGMVTPSHVIINAALEKRFGKTAKIAQMD